MPPPSSLLHHLLLLFATATLFPSGASSPIPTHFSTTTLPRPTAATYPLSPRAALLRYWSLKVPNGAPLPPFLLSLSSPLSAPAAALLAASPGRLASHCSAASILCFPSLPLSSSSSSSSAAPSAFSLYTDSNFSNYGTAASGGLHSFQNYSDNQNTPLDTFRRYSRNSHDHGESFASYSPDGNVVTANFTSYAGAASGGAGDFSAYFRDSNVPDLRFTNYDAAASGRRQSFSAYSSSANAGDQSFAGYGKSSTGVPTTFSSYAADTNVVGSTFSGYAEGAAGANDSFASYGRDGNVPQNRFSSYANGVTGSVAESFSSYRDLANVGDDSFRSYARRSADGSAVGFTGYGQSANVGSDSFRGYTGASAAAFRTYGQNTSFADYRKGPPGSATFADYRNTSSALFSNLAAVSEGARSGRLANKWVEPGKFFRESQLSEGTVMPMPDIRDRMPPRAFLPRSVADRLPFSSEPARLAELGRILNASEDTALWRSMVSTVSECEREPSRGETKRCVRSAEEMVDFATSVLGSDVAVRTTESTAGSGRTVEIGRVRGINGGRVTRSVSCHQSLFPYMVYYCHSVPRVRVYEAEILAVGSKDAINRGVAICHLDTSAWSEGHAAFVALGPGPGRIEVCHWIFQGDMTWATAD